MPRKLDHAVAEVLKKYGFGADACWDCHGTWVVYHKALEQIAAKAGIVFSPPQVIEASGQSKCAAICVTGTLGDHSEWSIGEAAPGNNKNAYPFAMAEKRAKDRVILKLIGIHGLVYSEDEADDFKDAKPSTPAPQSEPSITPEEMLGEITTALDRAENAGELDAAWSSPQIKKYLSALPKNLIARAKAYRDVREICIAINEAALLTDVEAAWKKNAATLAKIKEFDASLYQKAVDAGKARKAQIGDNHQTEHARSAA